MWHKHFLGLFRVWLAREATLRELSGLQVREPLMSQKSSDIDPVCIGFTLAKVLSVSPLHGWGKGLSSEARPHQPRAPIRVSAVQSGDWGSLSPIEGPR